MYIRQEINFNFEFDGYLQDCGGLRSVVQDRNRFFLNSSTFTQNSQNTIQTFRAGEKP